MKIGATLALEDGKTYQFTDNTKIDFVNVADVDGDGKKEIITVGDYDSGLRMVAQLCVWAY